MKYRTIVSIMGTFDIEVEADDDYSEAETKALDEAKKIFSEKGITEPQFEVEIIEELLDDETDRINTK